MIPKDAHECEDNESYIISDKMFTKTTNITISMKKCQKMGYTFGPVGSLINLLISDKAQMMPRGPRCPINKYIYNMSTKN